MQSRMGILAFASSAIFFQQVSQITVAMEKDEPRFKAAAKIDSALESSLSLKDPEQEIAVLKLAAEATIQEMGGNVFVADALRRMETTKTTDPRKLLKEWRKTLTEASDLLQFEVLVESPLPEGFPEPTPVGEIRVQVYPTYRVAKTEMASVESLAFWTLFNHIQKHDIAMTAPVEMTYSAEADGATKKTAMLFMYRSTEQGKLGLDGKVDVFDVPGHVAVSIGIRGKTTKERIADAKSRLENWLVDHRDEYESAGPLRIMGYNSPFVPDKKRFTEVQIPVIEKSERAR